MIIHDLKLFIFINRKLVFPKTSKDGGSMLIRGGTIRDIPKRLGDTAVHPETVCHDIWAKNRITANSYEANPYVSAVNGYEYCFRLLELIRSAPFILSGRLAALIT